MKAHAENAATIQEKASKESQAYRGAHIDLEKKAAATRSIAEQMKGTSEATQRAHDLELQMCDEATKAAIDELTHQELDSERELMRELEDVRRTTEATLSRARQECDKLCAKV